MGKPIICIDFDGVIHSYERGWEEGKIYGTVTEAFWDWAMLAQEDFKLVIYSSRSKTPEGIEAMKYWLEQDWFYRAPKQFLGMKMPEFEFAHEKPPAFLTIDDRCIRFEGTWWKPELDPKKLLEFKPWMQKSWVQE